MTELLPCPFCRSRNLEVQNTHTPSFWVKCLDCAAEVRGQSCSGPQRFDKFSYDPSPKDKFSADYGGLYPEYQQAFNSAVEAWNNRAPDPETARLKERVAELEGLVIELVGPASGMMDAIITCIEEPLRDPHGQVCRDATGRIIRQPNEISYHLSDWLHKARTVLAKGGDYA